ncbi:polysaccharide biosynthesis protein [Gracilibacillus oryzae]|uniref:Polysaccharide biosynthesis protein n=1 Tax=Gracilibacillus oryzae TaxID=1672701 RepID=A0A7C8KQ14_9BACI|nr:polysaccharide biosynthesis protein [Gracilibacillus oryzae]KAB8126500.1 polysaccharide biosynthesis protein [Gracilibacillus oryzae]
MTDKKLIFKGTFALVLASIFGKVISASYRIPLQNLTGDIGFYIYQQIYPMIGIAITLALYGLPSAVAAFLIENKMESGNKKMNQRIFNILFLLGLFLFLFLFLFSPFLANVMGDSQLIHPIRHVSWIFLFVPFIAFYRGKFQARNDLQAIAKSQIVEQIIRAVFIITAAIWIYQDKLSIYQIADGAAVGTLLAFSLAFLLLYFIWKKKYASKEENILEIVPYPQLISSVLLAGIVISMNHMMLLFVQLADAFTLVPALVNSGLSEIEAMKWKGVLDRGQPLLQLVTIIGSSIAAGMVPNVTKLAWQNNEDRSLKQIRNTLKYCFIISAGATAGLFVLMPEINELFYQNTDGSASLRILSTVLLFTGMSVTLASVLHGFGYMKWTALVLFIALWLKVVLNKLLVPFLQLDGAAIASILSIGFIFVSYFYLLRKAIRRKIGRFPVGRVLIAALFMIASLTIINYVKTHYFIIDTRLENLFFVLFSVFGGFIFYLFALVRLKVFSVSELASIPGLNKLSKKER